MDRDSQYDLLTAALLGVAIGAGAALLLGAGLGRASTDRPVRSALRRGQRWAGERGAAAGARLSPNAVRDQMREYMDSAREAVTDTVESELKDLRRSIRRQRKRLGV